MNSRYRGWAPLIDLFQRGSQESHWRELEAQLDEHIGSSTAKTLTSALVLNADETVAAADSGALFWAHVPTRGNWIKRVADRNI